MRKILIVDDDKGIIELFTELFESTALYEIYVAYSAEEAYEIASKNTIEVILTDYHMPGNDGLWLMSKVRVILPECKIVMMTGYASQALKLDSIKLGAMRFFEKPVNLSNLLRYVNELFISGNKYTGNIKDISLIDILQMLILTQESKLLAISIGEENVNSEIYLQRGMIIHSSYFDETGEEAFKKIITATNGDFQIRNYSKPPEQTIFTPSNNLLLNILIENDETHIKETLGSKHNEKKSEETKSKLIHIDQNQLSDGVSVFGVINSIDKSLNAIFNKSNTAFQPENESSFVESILNYIEERRIHRLFSQCTLDFSESSKPMYLSIHFENYVLSITEDNNHIIFIISSRTYTRKQLIKLYSKLDLV